MAAAATDPTTEALIAKFLTYGFDNKRAVDTAKNAALSASIVELAQLAGVSDGCDKTIGNLVYTIATKLSSDNKQSQRHFLASFVAKKELTSAQQLTEAIKYLERAPADQPINEAEFKDASGIGIVVTAEQITASVTEVISAHSDEITTRRYQYPTGVLIKELKDKIKWADGKLVKDEIDRQIESLLGPRTEADQVAPKSKGSKDSATSTSAPKASASAAAPAKKAEKPDLPFTKIKLRDLSRYEGQRVYVEGWAHNARQGGKKLWFIELRDGTGFVQAVLNGTETITRESTLAVYGTVSRPPGTNVVRFEHGLELSSDYWEFIQCAPVELELEINQDSSVTELLNKRHLVLRREKAANYMKLRSVTMQAFRQHYFDRGYFEVTPPTLVQTQAEGGSELFSLQFFEEPAYLTQSSQLYLETVCPAMGDVFCIASSYRAEESRTRRHLAEYTHVEAERPFITFEDLLNTIEDLVCDVIARVLASPLGETLRALNKDLKVPERPFMRMDYVQGLEFLKANQIYKPDGTPYEYGDDIPEAPERRMTDMIGRPILFCRFPVEMKAFYMAKCPLDPRTTESVDLLMPGVGEIVGGSMRIWQFDELMAAYQREGLDPSPYYWFTDQRKYGSFPHGGYGLGLERFLVWMLGDDHVRNVCLYPRYRGRCRP